MIRELTISSEYGDSLSLSMPGSSDGYLVKEIEGLDPVPVAIVSSSIATLDGEIYQASKREKRNIVLHIKLDKNYALTSIAQRRDRLYSLALGKQLLTLRFETDLYDAVMIEGRVEDVDAVSYTDDPMVILSIICPDPDFKAVDQDTFEGSVSDDLQTIEYLGSSPTGMRMDLYLPTVEVPGIRMEFIHRPSGRRVGYFERTLAFPTSSAEWWVFNSIPLQKGFGNTSGGSLLYVVNMDTLMWPTFIKGEIDFTVAAMSSWAGEMEYLIAWTTRYGAI